MTASKLHISIILSVLFAVCSPKVGAVIVTYQFTVAGGNGPLGDVIAQGHFSFDNALQPLPGQDFLLGDNLLTDLLFTWNGVTYDETTANTGGFIFDDSNEVLIVLFGNNCLVSANGCSLESLQDHWSIGIGFNLPAGGNIEYAHPSEAGFFFSDITATQVPVPSALICLFSALGVLGIGRYSI